MASVFVSYRREDSAYVAATINEKLRQHFGQESVFFDIDTIPLGTDFRKHISEAVGRCDILLAIIGDTWSSAVDARGQRRLDNPSDSVRLEIESALARDIPVIPVLVGSATTPAPADLPSSIQDLAFRNAAEVRPGRDLPQHLTRLLTGIESVLESRQTKRLARAPAVTAVIDPPPSPAIHVEAPARPAKRSGFSALPRWLRGLLILLAFTIAGFIGGVMGSAAAGGSDAGGFIVAIPIWLAGVVLAFRIWLRR